MGGRPDTARRGRGIRGRRVLLRLPRPVAPLVAGALARGCRGARLRAWAAAGRCADAAGRDRNARGGRGRRRRAAEAVRAAGRAPARRLWLAAADDLDRGGGWSG